MSSDCCSYQFHPEEWAQLHNHPPTLNETWSCDRQQVAGADHCLFHLTAAERDCAGIDATDIEAGFCSVLTSDEPADLEFIGATLDGIDLSNAMVNHPTNQPIDIRYATIDGDLIATESTVRQPLLLDGVTISGDLMCSTARFERSVSALNLTVSGRAIFDNTTFDNDVNYSRASFGGGSFQRAQFKGDGEFYRTTFSGDLTFRNTTWMGECSFLAATFEGQTDFVAATFHRRSDFRLASFGGTARYSKSTFDEEVLFIDSVFEQEALFKKTQFGAPAYFQQIQFNDETSFSEATFEDKSKFRFAVFHGEASISYATFDDNVYFRDVTFLNYAEFFECAFNKLADFRDTEFHDVGRFMNTLFNASAYFSLARFCDTADFRESTFAHTAIFQSTTFEGSLLCQRSRFETVSFVDLQTTNPSMTVDLEASRIHSGRLHQADSKKAVYYNLRNSVVGDLEITASTDDDLFDRLLIDQTSFEGFDFSRYRYALAPEWNLHRFSGTLATEYYTEASRFALETTGEGDAESTTNTESTSSMDGSTAAANASAWHTIVSRVQSRLIASNPSALETTYLKAKNGANEVGDSRAASKFFIREMRYRRQRHTKRLFDRSETALSRLRSFGFAVINSFLALSCGYGEKPYRTLLFSGLIIVLYAVAFWSVLPSEPHGTPVGYLLLSLQSFTTLVVGGGAGSLSFVPSFLAASEGFIGAFLIGLFVFTLTRSIHR